MVKRIIHCKQTYGNAVVPVSGKSRKTLTGTGLSPILVDDPLLLGILRTAHIVARVDHTNKSVAHVAIVALAVVIRLRLYCRKSDASCRFGAVIFNARVNFRTSESVT